jgi:hypothetical protein
MMVVPGAVTLEPSPASEAAPSFVRPASRPASETPPSPPAGDPEPELAAELLLPELELDVSPELEPETDPELDPELEPESPSSAPRLVLPPEVELQLATATSAALSMANVPNRPSHLA